MYLIEMPLPASPRFGREICGEATLIDGERDAVTA